MALLGHSQYHLAVAGGCAAFLDWSLRRTHPLPRGGTDCVQQGLGLLRQSLDAYLREVFLNFIRPSQKSQPDLGTVSTTRGSGWVRSLFGLEPTAYPPATARWY